MAANCHCSWEACARAGACPETSAWQWRWIGEAALRGSCDARPGTEIVHLEWSSCPQDSYSHLKYGSPAPLGKGQIGTRFHALAVGGRRLVHRDISAVGNGRRSWC